MVNDDNALQETKPTQTEGLSELTRFRVAEEVRKKMWGWGAALVAINTAFAAVVGWSISSAAQSAAEQHVNMLIKNQVEKIDKLNDKVVAREAVSEVAVERINKAVALVSESEKAAAIARESLEKSDRLISGNYEEIALKIVANEDFGRLVLEKLTAEKLESLQAQITATREAQINPDRLSSLEQKTQFLTVQKANIDGKPIDVTAIRGALKILDDNTKGFLLLRNYGQSKIRSENSTGVGSEVLIEKLKSVP